MSFRLLSYADIIHDIKNSGRRLLPVREFFVHGNDQLAADICLLRHDVDRLGFRAKAMARLEQSMGIRSTYYFRCKRNGHFNVDDIIAISSMGHEVGYHYECLSAQRGIISNALKEFEKNLVRLRKHVVCDTVSMHGAPLSRYDNGRLLLGQDLKQFGLLADASLSFSDIPVHYFTDTGGNWSANNNINFRDYVGSFTTQLPPPGNTGFVEALRASPHLAYISTHPERWAASSLGYMQAKMTDVAVGALKMSARSLLRTGAR